MSASMTGSAIDAMRVLTGQIDQVVQGLVDAHGFGLAEMKAMAGLAQAEFLSSAAEPRRRWGLTMTQAVDGSLKVTLRRPVSAAAICLDILVGDEGIAGLAEAVALALSFVAVSEQLGACSVKPC